MVVADALERIHEGILSNFWILILLLSSQPSLAQDANLLNPGGAGTFRFGAEHSFVGGENEIERQEANVNLPLYSDIETGFALTARGQRVRLEQPVYFPEHDARLPSEFGAASLGFAWSHESLLGDLTSVSVSYGYSGTRLLDDAHQAIINANFFYESRDISSSWLYFISYSNNRPTLNNIPIPGFAFVSRTKTSTVILGLPFVFLSWRPGLASLSLFASPFGASVEPQLRVWGPIQMFGRLAWIPRSYENLVSTSNDRLIMDSKEGGGGIRVFLGKEISVSATYLYAFDRRLLLGRSLTDSNAERVSLVDSGGFEVKARLSF